MSPHPLLFAWLLKHATVWNLYAAAKSYGFHRVYRRLLEANRRLVPSRQDQKIVQDNIKQAMRFPTKVLDVMDESHTVAFLQKYATELASGIEKTAPAFFVNAAKIVLGKTPLGKLVDIINDMRGQVDSNSSKKNSSNRSDRDKENSDVGTPSSSIRSKDDKAKPPS